LYITFYYNDKEFSHLDNIDRLATSRKHKERIVSELLAMFPDLELDIDIQPGHFKKSFLKFQDQPPTWNR
jgi:hypothetical protein